MLQLRHHIHIHACALAFHEAEMIGFKRKFEIKHKKTKKQKNAIPVTAPQPPI